MRNHIKQDIMNIHKITNGEPKKVVKSIIGTMQAPKFLLQKYGVGVFQVLLKKEVRIRRQTNYVINSRSYCKCNKDNISKGVKILNTIYDIRKSKKNFNFKRVYHLLLSQELFIIAYQNLKNKKGVITLGVNNTNPDGFNISIINKILLKLKDERFQFKPSRRIYIPKSNIKYRVLLIPSFEDKLVQEVIRIILESIYEPNFFLFSHGFRKRKRCHTALKDVRVLFAGVKWLITRDIEKCFDSFNHEKLVFIIRKRISDERFINLI